MGQRDGWMEKEGGGTGGERERGGEGGTERDGWRETEGGGTGGERGGTGREREGGRERGGEVRGGYRERRGERLKFKTREMEGGRGWGICCKSIYVVLNILVKLN
ncbi:hypothetical protein DCAR_0934168 [Daucus carota subsp. sativus]|uniref:Uncharacterized protein n=1 Tax=Daucus carota subsp. sativus TaxID=79200 RepID=A0AAF1BE45_DAUCS|nr:hypothetical protein DCAR_0934168 [Daucus carota subsp. sativus]